MSDVKRNTITSYLQLIVTSASNELSSKLTVEMLKGIISRISFSFQERLYDLFYAKKITHLKPPLIYQKEPESCA